MRKLVEATFATLDGVMQAPAGRTRGAALSMAAGVSPTGTRSWAKSQTSR